MSKHSEAGERVAQARHAARLLFDQTAAAHQLPDRSGRLLELAALYYAAGRQADADRPDRAGRELALAAPIADLTVDAQAIVACVVSFQRDKVRPQREPAYLPLGKKDRRTARRLGAILRIATALEAEPARRLLARANSDSTTVIVDGERPAELVAEAESRADLWRKAIGPLRVRVAEPGETFATATATAANQAGDPGALALELPALTAAGPVGAEPIAEAARRMLRRFFDKLLDRETDVRKGEDAEDVHQMRVATRRLRASLQVVEGVYAPELIRRYRRGLRGIAQSLGAVRDGDVFLEHLAAYRDALPERAQPSLEPLIAAVAAERAQARAQLLDDLRSKRYTRLKQAFAAFLTSPGAGALPPPEPGMTQRVRDFAGSAIWRRYELWRAYEVALPAAADETLHQARIAGKRLRYTLEFFEDALGPNVEQALAPLVALQESLGAFQDGVAARAHVARLGLADDQGARDYLAARSAERAASLAELPRLWEKVASATYRRRLFELIVRM